MRSKRNQKGNSDTALLFAFVLLFIIAIIALPKFLKWRENARIPAPVAALKRLYAAEIKYRTRISLKNTFASFRQLEETKQLPETCSTCAENERRIDGLPIELSRNYEETRLCLRSGNYAADTDGKIYESDTIACSAGEVAGTNLKEISK